jgi:DNA-binding winged helix-turn-helix (wHTH) protein/tetratricopeptide (TPR) repeat protein
MPWSFGPFRLDPDRACLWHEGQAIPLSPTLFAVLHYLVTHPDRLVTKAELLDAVWSHTAVTDAVLRVAIGTLRKVLGDTAQAPRYIATMPRRGYRFLAPVTPGTSGVTVPLAVPPCPAVPPPLLVGREAVLRGLWEAWSRACQGSRQVVWVTGEAGMGKTAVVEAFAAQAATGPVVSLATGQCIEHHGSVEAYLPILEALGQLCRGPSGALLTALLRQYAPTWLAQLPWLLTAADRAQLHHELQGTTRERMLREFAEVVDALTVETPLLLLLEDLHWSDYATVDLLARFARRQTPARLLVVGTYRPVEAVMHHPPLRTVVYDLQRQGVATELPLEGLSAEAVAAYLAVRFPHRRFPAAVAPWLHRQTEGHPLFLVTLVQTWVARGVLHARDGCWSMPGGLEALALEIPASLGQLLDQQIARLAPELQRVLEVASAAGVEFAAAAVAAGLETDAAIVEVYCDTLVRQRLLRALGVTTWPDGTVASRYAFSHVLYQQGLYQRLGAGPRVRLHRRLGAYLEAAYGDQAGDIAVELAEHFARGQDPQRAVRYLLRAAETATQRYAAREVIALATRALALLGQLPETPARAQHELDLHMILGPALIATKGQNAPEVEQTYARARVLCDQVMESPQLPQILMGLMIFHIGQGQHRIAQETGLQLLKLAQRREDPVVLLHAHGSLGLTALYLGDVRAGRAHLEHGIALCDRLTCRTLALNPLFDWGVVCRIGVAWALQQLGYADQARQRGEEALAQARACASPYNLCNALLFLALLACFRREWRLAQQWIEESLNLTTTPGFLLYAALGQIVRGATLTAQDQAQEGLTHIHQGLASCHTLGAKLLQPWGLAMRAESHARLGQPDAGLAALDEAHALMVTTHERFYAAEVARLRGELLIQMGGRARDVGADPSLAAAERCFHQALEVARRQQAKAWELRAAVSLARLWLQQGKRAAARTLLAEVSGAFTEGSDTVDLQEATALLEALS